MAQQHRVYGDDASPRSAPSGLPAAPPSEVARLLLMLGECGAHLRLLVCAGKSRDFKSNIRTDYVHCWVSQGQWSSKTRMVSERSDHESQVCVSDFFVGVPGN